MAVCFAVSMMKVALPIKQEKFPEYGTIVETSDGPATVAAVDIFTDPIKVRLKDQLTLVTYALEEVKVGE